MVEFTFLNLKNVLSGKMFEGMGRGVFSKILPQLYTQPTRKTIRELGERKIISINSGSKSKEIFLTEMGKIFAKRVMGKAIASGLKKRREFFKFNRGQKMALKELERIRLGQEFRWKYDQAPLTAKSVIQKVAIAKSAEDIDGKSIVCVGDDDLVSIAIALLGKPKEILVIDIDQDLLRVIGRFAKERKTKIETLKHDLRNPIPEKYRNKFDTFFTWPSETVPGMSLFVSRGVELLKNRGRSVGYMDMSPIEFHPLELLSILEKFSEMKVQIIDYIEAYGEGVYIAPVKRSFSIKCKLNLVKIRVGEKSRPVYRIFKGKIPYLRAGECRCEGE